MAGPLPEESGLPAPESERDLQVFAGRALAPWTLEAVDSSNHRRAITDSVVLLNGLQIQMVDRNVQGDSRRLQWDGSGPARVGFFANQRTDLSGYLKSGGALLFDVKVNRPPTAEVRIGMSCGTDCGTEVTVTDQLQGGDNSDWKTLSISLQCLAEKGVRMDMVLAPFIMETAGSMDLSVSSVRVVRNAQANVRCD